VGLGHQFLKHVERTKLLIHVVDISGSEGRDPIKDFEIINEELKKFNPALYERPQVIAANKMDITGAGERLAEFKEVYEPKGYKIFPISAATKSGLKELIYYVAQKLKELPDTVLFETEEKETVYSVKEDDSYKIYKENDAYVVEGSWIKKLVASTNFNDHESLQYFQRTIKRKGVIEALENMGIDEGDTVKMYDLEFEYFR